MRVVAALPGDFDAWLRLAAEVEPLFGPMVEEPGFHRALRRNVERGSAFCVREGNGPAGSRLLGGLLWSAHPPLYAVGWLAVAADFRRQGVARQLVDYALSLVRAPAEVSVVTFAPEDPGGEPARRFYRQMGFEPAEACLGPQGEPRQVFRRVFR